MFTRQISTNYTGELLTGQSIVWMRRHWAKTLIANWGTFEMNTEKDKYVSKEKFSEFLLQRLAAAMPKKTAVTLGPLTDHRSYSNESWKVITIMRRQSTSAECYQKNFRGCVINLLTIDGERSTRHWIKLRTQWVPWWFSAARTGLDSDFLWDASIKGYPLSEIVARRQNVGAKAKKWIKKVLLLPRRLWPGNLRRDVVIQLISRSRLNTRSRERRTGMVLLGSK